jgi:small basic protein
MFGKTLAYYLGLQAPALLAILVVFVIRLLMSAVGVPDSAGKVLSITAVLFLALPYYALRAKREGLTFKHLYVMCFVQGVFSQTLVALAIVLAIFTGHDNIYTIPEFYAASSGGTPLPVDGKNWAHAGAHVLFAGALVLPLVTWAVSSALLVIARRVKSW